MSLRTLAINIGNSRIACALMQSNLVLERYDHETSEVDSLEEGLRAGIRSHPERILIASVVPNANEKLLDLLQRVFPDVATQIVTHSRVPMPSVYEPETALGIDRLLGAFAAYELYARDQKRAVLIIDLGTATTFNCVSPEGVFLGGVITLGVASTFEAIGDQTSQLPHERLQVPKSVMATSTAEAIRSGVFFSSILAIKGLTTLLINEVFFGVPPMVLQTGGAVGLLSDFLIEGATTDPELVLKGIALLPVV